MSRCSILFNRKHFLFPIRRVLYLQKHFLQRERQNRFHSDLNAPPYQEYADDAPRLLDRIRTSALQVSASSAAQSGVREANRALR